jgi:hypothetical protein
MHPRGYCLAILSDKLHLPVAEPDILEEPDGDVSELVMEKVS